MVNSEMKRAILSVLYPELEQALNKIREKASMIESMDELQEKREEEKHTI